MPTVAWIILVLVLLVPLLLWIICVLADDSSKLGSFIHAVSVYYFIGLIISLFAFCFIGKSSKNNNPPSSFDEPYDAHYSYFYD